LDFGTGTTVWYFLLFMFSYYNIICRHDISKIADAACAILHDDVIETSTS